MYEFLAICDRFGYGPSDDVIQDVVAWKCGVKPTEVDLSLLYDKANETNSRTLETTGAADFAFGADYKEDSA